MFHPRSLHPTALRANTVGATLAAHHSIARATHAYAEPCGARCARRPVMRTRLFVCLMFVACASNDVEPESLDEATVPDEAAVQEEAAVPEEEQSEPTHRSEVVNADVASATHRAKDEAPRARLARWNVPTASGGNDGVDVQRWRWAAPADAPAVDVRVSRASMDAATELGLFRICGSEVEWSSERDCIGIWQVLKHIRSRSCDRSRIARITECANGEETALSAMRRASSRVMGAKTTRVSRLSWLARAELSCERPEGFSTGRHWGGRLRGLCEQGALLAHALVSGEDTRTVTGRAEPITWGGRCERDGGACDDPIACRRGLGRIPRTRTANAFWCKRGTPGCPAWIDVDGVLYSDLVCAALRIAPLSRVASAAR